MVRLFLLPLQSLLTHFNSWIRLRLVDGELRLARSHQTADSSDRLQIAEGGLLPFPSVHGTRQVGFTDQVGFPRAREAI